MVDPFFQLTIADAAFKVYTIPVLFNHSHLVIYCQKHTMVSHPFQCDPYIDQPGTTESPCNPLMTSLTSLKRIFLLRIGGRSLLEVVVGPSALPSPMESGSSTRRAS